MSLNLFSFWLTSDIPPPSRTHKHTHTGKISPNDLTVHTDVEIASTWSRRVHALERISDQVPVLNNYPAYSPFTLKSQLRYLFQTYPSVRGKTVFRSKDRLFLTKSIIVGYFDMGIFQEEGIITDILALHDANRGDKLTIGTASFPICFSFFSLVPVHWKTICVLIELLHYSKKTDIITWMTTVIENFIVIRKLRRFSFFF